MKKAAATDQASLPKIEKDADAAPTGDKNVGVGLAYLGYRQYDKAADLLDKGVTKGGVKNEAEARLLLGIAQLKAGHKDEAVKTFKAVKGDPTLERLANLWSLHAKQAERSSLRPQAPAADVGNTQGRRDESPGPSRWFTIRARRARDNRKEMRHGDQGRRAHARGHAQDG